MTQNTNFKRRVRARAARTGESYTAALRHFHRSAPDDLAPETRSVRLAVAQSTVHDDPRDIGKLRDSGLEMRRLMREARQAGARLLHFPEGATCSPNKRIMSAGGRENIGPADWDWFEWAVLREELEATTALARELGLWTVFGSVHQLSQPRRPHSSLHVSDRGELVTRYDERMLSNTKISFMYTPGSIPVTFEVDGLRFGCTLGMEAHFPEIFIDYERRDVDCVLFSTNSHVDGPVFAVEMQGHAASNNYWASFSVPAQHSLTAPSGIVAPGGRWAAQCPADGTPAIAVADIDNNPGDPARPWRRTARTGIYQPHMVEDDQRSNDRGMF
ncbi:amidohydrolase [Mesorhizobium sp. Root695]|uniref:carbon-nitrogen hydrolase family protein n=1 Tax=Mesorhizobium sp. Root695 TaxID=1736589 RepID=UPI00070C6A5A|nr:carbon-nitrogen hydrolase family protein [Mesorhizobium sp. Root695]KRB22234.1 amidohydrolase [Mesorhizobium sp. Root695]